MPEHDVCARLCVWDRRCCPIAICAGLPAGTEDVTAAGPATVSPSLSDPVDSTAGVSRTRFPGEGGGVGTYRRTSSSGWASSLSLLDESRPCPRSLHRTRLAPHLKGGKGPLSASMHVPIPLLGAESARTRIFSRSTWSTWSAVSSRTSRAGELRSAPSGPDDWDRVTGKRALAPRGGARSQGHNTGLRGLVGSAYRVSPSGGIFPSRCGPP